MGRRERVLHDLRGMRVQCRTMLRGLKIRGVLCAAAVLSGEHVRPKGENRAHAFCKAHCLN